MFENHNLTIMDKFVHITQFLGKKGGRVISAYNFHFQASTIYLRYEYGYNMTFLYSKCALDL